MDSIIIILHVIVCLALILIVLLQTGKGAGMGAAFGGGSSQTVFGSQGATGFLTKITAGAAIIFMLTSLGLSLFKERRIGGDSVMEGLKVPVQEEKAQPAAKIPVRPELPKEQAQPIERAPGEKK